VEKSQAECRVECRPRDRVTVETTQCKNYEMQAPAANPVYIEKGEIVTLPPRRARTKHPPGKSHQNWKLRDSRKTFRRRISYTKAPPPRAPCEFVLMTVIPS
jgi:hypothetical protein